MSHESEKKKDTRNVQLKVAVKLAMSSKLGPLNTEMEPETSKDKSFEKPIKRRIEKNKKTTKINCKQMFLYYVDSTSISFLRSTIKSANINNGE